MEIWENVNATMTVMIAAILVAEQWLKINLPILVQSVCGLLMVALVVSFPLMIIVKIWS